MNFENLTNGTNCNCLKNCIENVIDTFVRKTGDSKELKIRDFKTHFERGKEVSDLKNCDEVCGNRGLSIDLWNDNSKGVLLKRYMTTFAISPKLKNHLSIVKLKTNAGKVKQSPLKDEIGGEFHHDLYKSDNFNIDFIELIDNIPLKENVSDK
jgi:hypothetical protein